MRLTADEIRLITVLILIVVVGTSVKHYRAKQNAPPTTSAPAADVKAPSGGSPQRREN